MSSSLAVSKPLVDDDIEEIGGNQVEQIIPPHQPRNQGCIQTKPISNSMSKSMKKII